MAVIDAILSALGLCRKTSMRVVADEPAIIPSLEQPAARHIRAEIHDRQEPARILMPTEDSDEIETSYDFLIAMGKIRFGDKLIFITGKAGTGKTTFVRYLRSRIEKNLVVVAPTGIAALNSGGQTIHSFFRFPIGLIDPGSITSVSRDSRVLYEKIDVLVVDEVSMVRADVFDAIEKFMRINGRNPGAFFGGVQVILIGDLFQLPPVVAREDEQKWLSLRYRTPFFFSAKCLEKSNISFVEMKKNYRQTDKEFYSLLNNVRAGQNLGSAIERINSRCNAADFNRDDSSAFSLPRI